MLSKSLFDTISKADFHPIRKSLGNKLNQIEVAITVVFCIRA
jgi:hypothetical protein